MGSSHAHRRIDGLGRLAEEVVPAKHQTAISVKVLARTGAMKLPPPAQLRRCIGRLPFDIDRVGPWLNVEEPDGTGTVGGGQIWVDESAFEGGRLVIAAREADGEAV